MNTDPEQPEASPPPLPPEIPEVPLAPLWISLLVPPLATVGGNLLVGMSGKRTMMEQGFLMVPLVTAALILGFSFQFYSAVAKRYRGRSLGFLLCAYVLGQIIVCITLWFGSCVLFLG